MIITNYNTTEDMNNNVQQLKGNFKLNFHQLINEYYVEKNFN